MMASIVEELKGVVKAKNIYLKWEKPKEPLPKISVDRDKIRQVITNVIDNAIRYTEHGGITVKSRSLESKIQIVISDTGVGLTKYETSKMFESFSRGAAGTRLYTEGVGLGLYIARRFIEMHNGKIRAESKGKGKGSTFYIELPLSQ
jgi:signal transduction histidine kinase